MGWTPMISSSSAFQTVSLESTLSRVDARRRLFDALASDIDICTPDGLLVALVLVDVQDFHSINASYGFDFGDEVLSLTQRKLVAGLKKASIVGRIEGNTFAVVIPDLKSVALLDLAANKIRKILAEPIDVGMQAVRLKCNIGVSVYPVSEMTPEKLLLQAECSLNKSKSDNIDVLCIPKMGDEEAFSISEIERNLVKALNAEEFQFYYQPKVNLATGRADSAEALIRWQSEKLGFVSPEIFIPIAEQSRLIRKVTDWGIKNACREKAQLQSVIPDISLSINLSARDLYDAELIDVIDNAREIWSIDPETLTLEITEGVIMKNQDIAFAQLKKLKDRGIKISIDDFGTGYSSLAYFKNIPADELKIDKSFVLSLCESVSDASIVELVVSLAKKFNLSVVAEGIEDAEVLERLVDIGCDYGQGYYFSRPLPAAEFVDWAADFHSS